ncbi:MAG: LCP family protein [Chloroflexi bacterium]|nr:LCP family protein [Chloroflexota bacterium]MCL5074696.1 LCP family protein [Chloroflexota bacterium]
MLNPRWDQSHKRRGEPNRRGAVKHSGQGRFTLAIFALLFLIFAIGGLYFGYLFLSTLGSLLSGIPRPLLPFISSPAGVIDSFPTWKSTQRVNILLLGIDQRDDERGQPTRTDTMIILTIDPYTKSAGMFSIPRDLWVPIPGHGENKINTANFFGDMGNYPGGGPALAEKTVEYNFGVKIDYYARVDFHGFEKLIDALGGITLDVPKPVKDDEYPTGNYGVIRVLIPAGLQRMDGRTALQYARSRHGDNDIARTRRQQEVLLAARNEAIGQNLLPKLPSMLGILRDAVKTDIPPNDILALAKLGKDINPKNIALRSIDETMFVENSPIFGALMPKRDEIRKVIEEVFFDARLRKEAARVEVWNGTNRNGLAAAVAEVLKRQGYNIVNVAQADRSDYRETIILDHTDKRYTVEQLATLLHISKANIRTSSDISPNSDIVVILGANARVPE